MFEVFVMTSTNMMLRNKETGHRWRIVISQEDFDGRKKQEEEEVRKKKEEEDKKKEEEEKKTADPKRKPTPKKKAGEEEKGEEKEPESEDKIAGLASETKSMMAKFGEMLGFMKGSAGGMPPSGSGGLGTYAEGLGARLVDPMCVPLGGQSG